MPRLSELPLPADAPAYLAGHTAAGAGGRFSVTALAAIIRAAAAAPLTSKYVTAGIPSYDSAGNYVQDGGGIYLGGTSGVWLRQEGFASDYEEGSWVAYPTVANRWCGLSICPSGDPWNLPRENVSSLALQLRNGANEERLTVSAKWFGNQATGGGEYRIAPFKTGLGKYWPLTIGNNDTRQMWFGTNQQVHFTNESYNGGSAGNTSVLFYNPGTTASFRAVVRATDGVAGFEVLSSDVAAYELQLLTDRILSTASIFQIDNTHPLIFLRENDQTANTKLWAIDAEGGEFRIMAGNDAGNTFSSAVRITRSTSNVQNIILFALPTSSTGLPSGALWKDPSAGNAIKQVP
jgi:hypothetical protein